MIFSDHEPAEDEDQPPQEESLYRERLGRAMSLMLEHINEEVTDDEGNHMRQDSVKFDVAGKKKQRGRDKALKAMGQAI